MPLLSSCFAPQAAGATFSIVPFVEEAHSHSVLLSQKHPLPQIMPFLPSRFAPQAAGATFGIVPFVSRRAYGVVTGFVGAGSNTGGAICQALWFGAAFPYQQK